MMSSVVYLSFPTSNHNRGSSGMGWEPVVYLSFPTSNHNFQLFGNVIYVLYIFLFLHQTTTHGSLHYGFGQLYIFLFLHQTTTILSIQC